MADDAQLGVGLGRRKRRIERRRREIMEVAARVFAQKGFASTTTRDLAAAADIAEGTLYNYFANKREILVSIAQEADAPMEVAVREAAGLDSRDAMIAMVDRAVDLTESNVWFLRTLLAEVWMNDEWLEGILVARLRRVSLAIERFIADRVASGQFRSIDPALGARLAMGMIAGLVLPVLRGVETPHSPQQRRLLAEATVDVLLDGVRIRAYGQGTTVG